ncbi:MAG: leucine-rich repeat domain-containing protein [Clostridiales bacterium]|nr:leucine-rich repeat domain-containing protein [Clostridiales bacterium]
MMENTKVISKGSYSTFRFNDFVSVKQYLLIREKNEKYLLLKFCNDAQDTVTGLKLTIDQLDVRGVCVEKSHVEWNNLNGLAGSQFVAPEKIPLRENCVEVKINLIGAVYGEYTYSVKSNELVVVYDKKTVEKHEDYSINTQGEKVVIHERKFKRPFSIVAASIGVILCAMAGTLIHLYNFKNVERRFLWDGLQYEFTTADKEVGAPIRVVGYTGTEPDLIIPAELEGYPVVSVSSSAFRGNSNIRSLKIEANVEIANNAFENCHNLATVELSNVTKVGDEAFYWCSSLRDVTINNVPSIGKRAFMNCQSMRTLTITGDKQVLTMGNEAFAYCTSLKTVDIEQAVAYPSKLNVFMGITSVEELSLKHYNSAKYEDTTDKTIADLFGGADPMSLAQLTIADIDEIPEEFCANNNRLKKVDLQGLKSSEISDKAFYKCNALTLLSLGFESKNTVVTSVGDYAFYETSLVEFDGKNLTKIGDYAFAENTSLTTMNVAENTKLTQLGKGAFQDCSALTSFQVAKGITALPDEVFDGCRAMTSLTLGTGSTLNSIGDSALKSCESLTAFKMPATMKTIGDSAFENCKSLPSISIPNSVTSIGGNAFAGCTSFTEMKIPSAVNTLGFGALRGCDALKSLETPFVGSTEGNRGFLAAMFGGWSTSDYSSIPATLQTVTLTGSSDILDEAFYRATSLKKVTLGDGTREIGQRAFYGCSNLREMYLNEELETIEYDAFTECYLLFEVWNLSQLPIVRGEYSYGGIAQHALAVYNTEGARNEIANENDFRFLKADEGWYMVDYLGTNTGWTLPTAFNNAHGGLENRYTIVSYLFRNRTDVEHLTITSGVEGLGDQAFAGCSNLKTITYKADVLIEEIGANAYESCYSLTTVTIPYNCQIERIGDSAFAGCSALKTISLPNSLKEIGSYAFNSCSSLSDLTVGNNVTFMGYGMLSGANSLKKLTVPFLGETADTNNYLAHFFAEGADSYHWASVEEVTVTSMNYVPNKAFYGFDSLKTVTWSSNAERIGASAFADCNALQSVNIRGVKEIGEYAFSYCTNLQSMDLGNSLATIGNSAFADSGLKSISFPASVKTIDDYAFSYTQLSHVSFPRYLETLGDYAFRGNQNLTLVDMTKYSLSYIPSYAFSDCYALESITIPSSVSEIEYGAFENCSQLYEVYNLSSYLSIVRGESTNGSVAYNAVIVHDSLSDAGLKEATVDGMVFKYAESEGEACLFKYEGSAENLTFAAVRLGNKTYSTYWIYRNAFEGNYSLQSLNTGVVKEIGAYAFYNCNSLKEVTIAGSLSKCGDYAFGNCSNLWEVWDDNYTFTLSKGDSGCGYVAYYAVAINKDITYSIAGNSNEFKFMSFDGKTYLYRYDGYGYGSVVELPEIGSSYELFKDDRRSPVFDSWGMTLVVPLDVKRIPVGAIGAIGSIYYKGNAAQWTSVATEQSISRDRVYYYKECIHNNDTTKSWTKYNGSYTTGETYYYTTVTITEATCKQAGKQVDRCQKCNLDFHETILSKVNHSFSGTNGACKWCGQTPVKTGDLGSLLDVQNDTWRPYFINASKSVYSDWREDYDNWGSYTSAITFTAKANIKLSFDLKIKGDENVTCRILINGKEFSEFAAQDVPTMDLELVQGDRIKFEIIIADDSNVESRIYINNIKATEIKEGGV